MTDKHHKADNPEKYDKNQEIFQMRAQWKKADNCRKLWYERWSWLLDEREKTFEECEAIRAQAAEAFPRMQRKVETVKSLKPVPVTSTGVIGWLASRPDCQLEIYTSWLAKPPLHLPDMWEHPDYGCAQSSVQPETDK